MSKAIKIRKGLDIRLQGEAKDQYGDQVVSSTFAVIPPDFHGLVPKLSVAVGDEVKAGSPLLYDKNNHDIKFASPVSGEVIDVVRGAKRRILEVKVLADKSNSYEDFGAADPNSLDREEVKTKMMAGGVWPFVRQRPFSTIADPNDTPKCIVVSCTDTHPLAPYNDFIIDDKGEDFQAGLDALAKLTDGAVHLTMVAGKRRSEVFLNASNCERVGFSGPHPAGNVGVQIHQLDPIDKGDAVWYTYPQDVVAIGRLFRTGQYDARRVVALTGSEVKEPQYYNTMIGAEIKGMLADNIATDNVRYVMGNCLTGRQVEESAYMSFYETQITVLPEGDEYKFLLTKGWLGPGFDKFSASNAFPTKFMLLQDHKWRLDTNSNGEHRAFVVTGQYEQVFPFDIYPVQLVKACITNDLDGMEQLGIYEVDAEDFALCEYVCTSKINSMQIIRDGLDLAKEECF